MPAFSWWKTGEKYTATDYRCKGQQHARLTSTGSQFGDLHLGLADVGAFRHGAHDDPRLRRQENRDHAGLAAEAAATKDAAQKHVTNTSFDSVALSTDTETDNTW